MRAACKEIDANYEPGFTIVIVQKRHRAQFPRLGGWVECQWKTMKEDGLHDFYFCFHRANLVSSRLQDASVPPHYTVVHDDNHLLLLDVQVFTYYLCHTYMGCCRSTSHPAPTYYSHLAAYRARQWMSGMADTPDFIVDNQFIVNQELDTKMYFL